MSESKIINTLCGLRVRVGPLLVIGVFLAARSTWRSLAVGLAVASVGLLIRAWASGHIQKEKKLAISGPYRHTRNPLYLGNFVLGIGIAAATNSTWGVALFFLYFGLFYPPVIIEERERMRRLFPAAYADYTRKVPLFFPRLRPSRDEPSARHSPVDISHGRVRRKWTPGQSPGARPPSPGDEDRRFRWALYRKNREQRALLGTAFVWALLVAKMLLF